MEVSVVVIAYNEARCIGECLQALLEQSFRDFEIIVVDDGSTDKTEEVVRGFSDSRIRCVRQDKNRGVAVSRNAGIKEAAGRYIFFTDADCLPGRYWLEEGLRIFRERPCPGVEGRSFYASARVTLSDISFEALKSGHFSTSNIAFTREALERAGGFNGRYARNHEDLDLALRVKQHGEIFFSPDMIVVHREEKYTVGSLFRYASRCRDTVRFIKDHPRDYRQTLYWRNLAWHRVLYPKKLLVIFFPFLLVFCHNLRSWRDAGLLPFVYLSTVYLRLIIWKEAFKERVFFI